MNTAIAWIALSGLLLLLAAEELWEAAKDRRKAKELNESSLEELGEQHIIMSVLDLLTLIFFLLAGLIWPLEDLAVVPLIKSVLHWTVVGALFAGLICFGLRMWRRRTIRARMFAARGEANGMAQDTNERVREMQERGLADQSEERADREEGRSHRNPDDPEP